MPGVRKQDSLLLRDLHSRGNPHYPVLQLASAQLPEQFSSRVAIQRMMVGGFLWLSNKANSIECEEIFNVVHVP